MENNINCGDYYVYMKLHKEHPNGLNYVYICVTYCDNLGKSTKLMNEYETTIGVENITQIESLSIASSSIDNIDKVYNLLLGWFEGHNGIVVNFRQTIYEDNNYLNIYINEPYICCFFTTLFHMHLKEISSKCVM